MLAFWELSNFLGNSLFVGEPGNSLLISAIFAVGHNLAERNDDDVPQKWALWRVIFFVTFSPAPDK